MQIVQVVVGPLATNCYLLKEEDRPETLVVDPGGDAEAILEALAEVGGTVQAFLCTHGHPDHTGALRRLLRAIGAPVYLHPADQPLLHRTWPEFGLDEPAADSSTDLRNLREGDTLPLGDEELRVLHTPGHTPGCLCLLGPEFILTGDTLFANSVGRTDLPGGDEAALRRSLARLRLDVSPITLVYPGHGPSTVFTQELTTNPWLVELAPTEDF